MRLRSLSMLMAIVGLALAGCIPRLPEPELTPLVLRDRCAQAKAPVVERIVASGYLGFLQERDSLLENVDVLAVNPAHMGVPISGEGQHGEACQADVVSLPPTAVASRGIAILRVVRAGPSLPVTPCGEAVA